MPHIRGPVAEAIARARSDLDRSLSRLESLAADDRQRVSYSIHALNNYMMVVSSTILLLKKRLNAEGGGDADVRRWLDSLKNATNLMMITARGVLTANSELPPLLIEPVSLGELAQTVCATYRDTARSKRIRIACKVFSKRNWVLTDRVAAAAVLDNLMSNAVKYSTLGSQVGLTVDSANDEAYCLVRDSGPGISDADQANLFQKGFRLSTLPTGGEPSTGYGLAVAQDLAKALGGRLSCASILGEGSCFTFALPLAADEGKAVADSERPWPREVRVLQR